MAKLHFYYSAMNAGKTTTLLQSSYNYNERGMKTLIFLPTIDTRHNSTGRIASRIGLEDEAIAFNRDFDFFPYVRQKQQDISDLACVFVDEAQFLTKNQVQSLVNVVHFLRLPVLTYGLRTDFRGEAFEGSQYLLAWAEELIEIKTICHCGKKATNTLRVRGDGAPIFEGEQIEIGGEERYVSVCRRHFEEARGQLKPDCPQPKDC